MKSLPKVKASVANIKSQVVIKPDTKSNASALPKQVIQKGSNRNANNTSLEKPKEDVKLPPVISVTPTQIEEIPIETAAVLNEVAAVIVSPLVDATDQVGTENSDVPVPIEEPPPAIVYPSGNVKLIYEQYDELFPVDQGSLTMESIDEVYCLTFVMPGCSLHLSELSPTEKTRLEQEGLDFTYEKESPAGVFHNIDVTKNYYVYVEQEADRLARDQEAMRARLNTGLQFSTGLQDKGGHKEFYESCSCLFGNPCVDEYICKDWNNREAIAFKHGWKGF
jgi:hypothetical protein